MTDQQVEKKEPVYIESNTNDILRQSEERLLATQKALFNANMRQYQLNQQFQNPYNQNPYNQQYSNQQNQQPQQPKPEPQPKQRQENLTLSMLSVIEQLHALLEIYSNINPTIYPEHLKKQTIKEIEHLRSFQTRFNENPIESKRILTLVSNEMAPKQN